MLELLAVDQLTNPYTPGAGSPPPALAGRDDELEAFRPVVARLAAGRDENALIRGRVPFQLPTRIPEEPDFRGR